MTQIAGYCTNCGAGWQAGENYCGSCGVALRMTGGAESAGTVSGSPVLTGQVTAVGADSAGPWGAGFGVGPGTTHGLDDEGRYPRETVVGAVLLTIFIPFIALIAALVLRAQEARPMRREQLKNWAIASGAWLATGWVIGIVVFASLLNAVSPSGCKGGIDLSVPPSYQSSDGTHWVGTFRCMNGGTITKPVPASQVPGG